MSARPRPVTATIKPASMAPPVGVRTRSYSLSSGSSTASLVSVLDHDSYESLPDSDIEEQPVEKKKSLIKEQKPTQQKPELEKMDENENDITSNLSPWEKWLLKKAQSDRKQAEEEARRERRLQRKKEKEEKEKEELKRKAEEKYQEWLEKTTMKLKIQTKEEKRRSKTKEEIEKAKKEEIEQKSRERFEEWQKKKKEEELERKKAEKERKQKEEAEKEEKRKKCEEVFAAWCEKAKTRPKPVCSSYGYAGGKLTGYHDKSAPPVPSYYNPIPWQPIHVPQPKADSKNTKKRPSTAPGGRPGVRRSRQVPTPRWNPHKYL